MITCYLLNHNENQQFSDFNPNKQNHSCTTQSLYSKLMYVSLFTQEIDTYKLVIQATDLDGRAEGNTGKGEIEIKILDINDNVPTLEKDSVGVAQPSLSLLVCITMKHSFPKATVGVCSMKAV